VPKIKKYASGVEDKLKETSSDKKLLEFTNNDRLVGDARHLMVRCKILHSYLHSKLRRVCMYVQLIFS
jgi:hypothetical protein